MVTTFCGEGDDKQTTMDFKLYECHIFIITSLSLLLFHWVNSHLLWDLNCTTGLSCSKLGYDNPGLVWDLNSDLKA